MQLGLQYQRLHWRANPRVQRKAWRIVLLVFRGKMANYLLEYANRIIISISVLMDHFRVHLNLHFKSRLSAKSLYENQFSFIFKLELITIKKLDSFWKRDWGELGNGPFDLLRKILHNCSFYELQQQQQQKYDLKYLISTDLISFITYFCD